MENKQLEPFFNSLVCPRCLAPISERKDKKFRRNKKKYVLRHLLLYHWREIPSVLDDGKIKIFKPSKYQKEIVSFKQLFSLFKPVVYSEALTL